MNKEIKQLKKNIRELTEELNQRISYMDESNLKSITRLTGWINKDAFKILMLLGR